MYLHLLLFIALLSHSSSTYKYSKRDCNNSILKEYPWIFRPVLLYKTNFIGTVLLVLNVAKVLNILFI